MLFNVEDIEVKDIIESIPLQKRVKGNQTKSNNNFYYKDVICAFDIEVTRYKIGEHYITKTVKKDDEVSILYIWQFQIGLDITIIGRTWDDFLDFMMNIADSLKDGERICIYVHNLSFEWSFIRDKNILGKYIDDDSVFILSSRKILKFLCFNGKIEFRCSYIHTNMSLDLFTSKMNVKHKKLDGKKFDYNKKRFPWTELTEYELQYCINDVIGLVEALTIEMDIDKDNLYTIPLTSTGYVRRDIRKAIRDNLPKEWVKERKTDFETYLILRECFRGGNTHANPLISGKTIKGKICEYDRSSSYPDVQLNQMFPIGKFSKPRYITNESYEKCIEKGYAVIARIEFVDLKLRNKFEPVPYISKSNCSRYQNIEEDNGRVIKADVLFTSITELDMEIITKQYDYKYKVVDYRIARKGYLPECIKEVIRTYYRLKTKLKGDKTNEIIYMKSKNKLNSIYGNSAQDGGKIGIIYKDSHYFNGYRAKNGDEYIFIPKELKGIPEEKEEIREYNRKEAEKIQKITYANTNTVLPYQFGVYTTALARFELQRMIDICKENFLYCDTDSVYFVQDGKISFNEYNEEKIKLSIENRAFAEDSKGKFYYMGVADLEIDTITAFKTLGAKKYCYIYYDEGKPKLNMTVSGVSKKYGAHELLRSFAMQDKTDNPLDLFAEDYVFKYAGGNEIFYNDTSTVVKIDGIEIYVPVNAVIRPSTYQIGLGEDYFTLLNNYGYGAITTIVFNDYYNIRTDTELFF